jgi:hypothetical protein
MFSFWHVLAPIELLYIYFVLDSGNMRLVRDSRNMRLIVETLDLGRFVSVKIWLLWLHIYKLTFCQLLFMQVVCLVTAIQQIFYFK